MNHGESKPPTNEYRCWLAMRDRCRNQNNHAWLNYGGRGIKVCKRWNNYLNFLADMGRKPTAKHSIDRIDNNKGYSPSNCRWATMKEQTHNMRHNRFWTAFGKTQSVSDWAAETGISYQVIDRRLEKGMSLEDALTVKRLSPYSLTPKIPRARKTSIMVHFEGKKQPLSLLAHRFGIHPQRIWFRIYRHGWDLERALTTPLKGH